MRKKRPSKNQGSYKQNHGKRGIVYILRNDTFPELLKIGQTTNLEKRLIQLNNDCKTGNPISRFFVAYQRETEDCGRAEEYVHEQLADHRPNSYREFFRVDLNFAISTVEYACQIYDHEHRIKREAATIEAERLERKRDAEIRARVAAQMAAERAENAAIYERTTEAKKRLHEQQKQASQVGRTIIEREEEAKQNYWSSHNHKKQSNENAAIQEVHRQADWKETVKQHEVEANNNIGARGVPFIVADPLPSLTGEQQEFSWQMLFWAFCFVFAFGSMAASCNGPDGNPQRQPAIEDENPIYPTLKNYAAGYPYPEQRHDDEAILTQVVAGKNFLIFNYQLTDLGRKAVANGYDQDTTRQIMNKTACNKKELIEFISKGISVIYRLHIDGSTFIEARISC